MSDSTDADGTDPDRADPGGTDPGGTDPGGTDPGGIDPDGTDPTRAAWNEASRKHIREYAELLAEARTYELLPPETAALAGLVEGARVVHPFSGHGLEDVALARLGAASVVGLDYSERAVESARRRAEELDVPVSYVLRELPDTGLEAGSTDLVYTGKGALIWVRDLDPFLAEVHRILRPGGRLYVYEAHPLFPLWTWEPDRAEVRPDRSYFAESHTNESFPAHGAIESQHRFSEIVMAVVRAGFALERLEEHPDPFWDPMGVAPTAAWDGRLPNAFSLLARRLD